MHWSPPCFVSLQHIVVFCNGNFYIVKVSDRYGSPVALLDLERQLEWIKHDAQHSDSKRLFYTKSRDIHSRNIDRAFHDIYEVLLARVTFCKFDTLIRRSTPLPGQIQKCPNDFQTFPNDIQIFQVNFTRFQVRFRNSHVNFRYSISNWNYDGSNYESRSAQGTSILAIPFKIPLRYHYRHSVHAVKHVFAVWCFWLNRDIIFSWMSLHVWSKYICT